MNHQVTTCHHRKPLGRPHRVVISLCALALICLSSQAQNADPATSTKPPAKSTEASTPTNTPPAPPAPPTGSQVQYVGPDTYILLDSQGRPQPMPGMTYEDFLTAWKKLNRPNTTNQ